MKWTEECELAFQDLKLALCSTPVLRAPDFSKIFILQTDASERGVRAVLSQHDDEGDDNGRDYPVAYFSRKLLPREKYSTVEKEYLGVKLGVQAFVLIF